MRRRKSAGSLVLTTLALAVLAMPAVGLADGRVALVVGNSTYVHVGRLPNPENDARDLAAALRRLEFEVPTELDADGAGLTEALRRFTRRSAGADVSLVFYAGPGIEMDGTNYVVPVDARLERDIDMRYETVTLDLLVSTAGAAMRLVLLDACRSNPQARSMQRTAATRTVSGGTFGDLNEDLLGDETLGRMPPQPQRRRRMAGAEAAVPAGAGAGAGSDERRAASHEYHSLVSEHYLTRTLPAGASVTVSASAPGAPAPADPPRPDPLPTDVTELPVSRRLGHTGPEDMSRVAKNVYAIDCDDFNNSIDPPVGHTYFLHDQKGAASPVFVHIWHALTTGRADADPTSRTKVCR